MRDNLAGRLRAGSFRQPLLPTRTDTVCHDHDLTEIVGTTTVASPSTPLAARETSTTSRLNPDNARFRQ